MSEVWTIIGICLVILLGAALPLLRQHNGVPSLPPKAPKQDSNNDQ